MEKANIVTFHSDTSALIAKLQQWAIAPRSAWFPTREVLNLYNQCLPDARGCYRKMLAQQILIESMPLIESTSLHYLEQHLLRLIAL